MDENICKICNQVDCNNKAHLSLIQRDIEYSQPFYCPFCGKENCSKLLHIFKLLTLPYIQLRPKHKFMLYGVVAIIGALLLFVGMLIKLMSGKDLF